MKYIVDPVTKRESVSLTFLLIVFVLVVGSSITNVLGYTAVPESLIELFYGCAALYFGRRFQSGKTTVEAVEKIAAKEKKGE